MKLFRLTFITAFLLTPLVALAQNDPNAGPPDPRPDPPQTTIAQQSPPVPVPAPQAGGPRVMIRTGGPMDGGPGPQRFGPMDPGEFGPGGAWWKNSDVVSKLQLSDEQVKNISKAYLDHKLKLIDLQANVEKQELLLQPLLDVDQPDQSKVGAQIDSLTSARGRLEKENAMMMLDIRRWLSVAQWRKLKSLQADEGPVVFMRAMGPQGNVAYAGKQKMFFTQTLRGPCGPGVNIEGPPPPPLPQDTPAR